MWHLEGGFGDQNNHKSGKIIKRLARLAPNLAHVMFGFIWELTNAKKNKPLDSPEAWGGGLGGQQFKSLGKLRNGWTDWHQIWYMSADSSGNGYRIKTIRGRLGKLAVLRRY